MRNLFPRAILLTILVATMSGCASQARHTHADTWFPTLLGASQTDELLQDYDAWRKQSPAELTRDYDKARQSLVQTKNNVNRLRVALLLSLPNTSFHDNGAALTLTNEVLKDTKSAGAGLRGLASLLNTSLNEQQKIAEDGSQKLKDEQRRADGLQEKVDAIKKMEKNLIRRDQR